ncbi:hypothetical protein C0Q70_15354 [Pomacea canaliculata]|uniref:Reverse transcriptase domain-containing protein n=1 Tax=Pomacea canaliculata TaxID=400727 RepID=A0A2T7NUN5_POMCA|nr:hypothetical protein C0Q70_15354 [Pomacea canaliculata]
MLGDAPLTLEDQQTYLGIAFDKRLTWKQHILDAEAKARRKLNIMRKLAGTHWGANEKILKTVYQGTVRPHLEYGSSTWMTAAKSHLQTLDKVQKPSTESNNRRHEIYANRQDGADNRHTPLTREGNAKHSCRPPSTGTVKTI